MHLILKYLLSFVLLHRDDTPHADLGEEVVLPIISNLTHIISQVFPSKWNLRDSFILGEKPNINLYHL